MTQKACLFNLIVYSDDKSQIPYLNEIASSIVTKYPARIIILHSDKNIDGVNINTKSFAKNGFQLYEQVNVELPSKYLNNISLFVLPYLIPDYPICLFYSGNPAKESPVFNSLIRLSNRLIVDSETSDNMPAFCSTITDQIMKHRMDVIDLNWARTLGWRLTLADLFDSQEKLNSLSRAKSIKFAYKKGAHSLNPALYLQAWIASSFGWEYLGRNEMEIRYGHKEGFCIFSLESTDKPDSIQISADLGYECLLSKDSPQVCIHISSADACDLPYKLYFPNFQKGSSYLTQLLYSTTSKQYCNMLPMLKRFYE